MNLAIRDIRYHRGRFVLTSVGLGLLIGVVISMGGIYRGLIADDLSVPGYTGADLWVVQRDTNGPFAESSRIPEDTGYRIAAVPGVAEASPLSFQTIQIERFGKPFRFFLIGYAQEEELDSAGRVLIAPTSRQWAGLEKQVWLVGQGTHFELWSDAGWQKQQEAMLALASGPLPAGFESLAL